MVTVIASLVRPVNRLCLVMFLAFASTVMASPGVWYDGNKVAPDRPYQKAKDGLGVQLQLTKDAAFFTDWALPQPPNLAIARTAQIGDRVYSVLLFFGAGRNPKGESNVTFSGRVLDPQGKPLQAFEDVRVLQGPNRADEYNLCLSEGYMTAQFSAESRKGVYTFELTVSDHVKMVSIPLVQTIEMK